MKKIFSLCMLIGTLLLFGCGSPDSMDTQQIQGTWTLDNSVLQRFDAFNELSRMDQAMAKKAIESMQGATMKISDDELYFKLSDKPGDNSTWEYTVAGKTGNTWVLDTTRYKGTSREQKSQMKATLSDAFLLLDMDGTPIAFRKG